MTIGINLHAVVRGIIETLHPDENLLLYQNMGQTIGADGVVRNSYLPPRSVRGQVQNLTSEQLEHSERISTNTDQRRIYLFAPDTYPTPAPMERYEARTGDMVQRENGEWLLVTCMADDFRRVGWVCLCATLQSIGLKDEEILTQLPAPTITPESGEYDAPVTVTLTPPTVEDNTAVISLLYTTDGSDAATYGKIYGAPFEVYNADGLRVNAVARAAGYADSAAATVYYTFKEDGDNGGNTD